MQTFVLASFESNVAISSAYAIGELQLKQTQALASRFHMKFYIIHN